jgi:NADH-quinone oxidoreductase subunit G
MVAAHPVLGMVDQVPQNDGAPVAAGRLGQGDFRAAIGDFYLTNPVARASALMGELSAMEAARGRTRMAAE